MRARILVLNSEESIHSQLKPRLEQEGLDVEWATTLDQAQSLSNRAGDLAVIVIDQQILGKDAASFMRSAREKFKQVKTIIVNGHADNSMVVNFFRSGVSDYFEKPIQIDQLAGSIRHCAKEYHLELMNENLINSLESRLQRIEGQIEEQAWHVSESKAMDPVNELMNRLRRDSMRADAPEPPVLLMGEKGSGKESIARMIHSRSRRGKGPWVALNCALYSDQLLESELLGHEQGVFKGANFLKLGVFEIAKTGTLLLDKIGSMDPQLQNKLDRILRDGVFRRIGGNVDQELDVRLIVTTDEDLEAKVEAGKFSKSLYDLLIATSVMIPSLRDRQEDLVPMANQFAKQSFQSLGKHFEGFTSDAESALVGYDWPGNVRELLIVVERLALTWEANGLVSAEALSIPSDPEPDPGARSRLHSVPTGDDGVLSYTDLKRKWCDSFEKDYLISKLNKNDGNVSAAAREAKLDRSNFLRLLRKHGVRAQQFRRAA